VVAAVDYALGPYIIVPTYVVIPVMLLAWNWGERYAIGLGVVLTIAHFVFLDLWGVPPPTGVAAVNAAMRFAVLVVLAVVTARLGSQTRASRERVQMLEGILPICSFCKDIRDEAGEWQKIETYVSRHSEAQFSHGICAKCTEIQLSKFRSQRAPGKGAGQKPDSNRG
jgi:hypothetical protein